MISSLALSGKRCNRRQAEARPTGEVPIDKLREGERGGFRQQLGPGPRTLRERTRRARLTKASSYLDEIERLCEFRDRLEEYEAHSPDTERAVKEIARKISHLEHRARLPRVRVARIPSVLQQTLEGYYWRYSTGWSSIAKDLLLS